MLRHPVPFISLQLCHRNDLSSSFKKGSFVEPRGLLCTPGCGDDRARERAEEVGAVQAQQTLSVEPHTEKVLLRAASKSGRTKTIKIKS